MNTKRTHLAHRRSNGASDILCLLLSLAFTVPLASCNRGSATKEGPAFSGGKSTGIAVAKIGSRTLSASDIEQHLAGQTEASRLAYADKAARRQLVDGVVRFELLAAAAEKRGYARDPQVLRGMKQQMIARMLEDDAAKLPETVISADDIARYYEDHRDEFEKPAAASIRRIVVKDKETAEIVATQAKAARKPDFAVDQRAFEELALRHGRSGEDAAGKESPFFEEKGAPYPEAVTRAVFAMTELGVVAGPIETEQGFQVIKLAGRRAEVSRALGEVREQIRQRLLLDRRNKRMEAFVSELRKNVLVEVDEGALEKMRLDESSTDSKASP